MNVQCWCHLHSVYNSKTPTYQHNTQWARMAVRLAESFKRNYPTTWWSTRCNKGKGNENYHNQSYSFVGSSFTFQKLFDLRCESFLWFWTIVMSRHCIISIVMFSMEPSLDWCCLFYFRYFAFASTGKLPSREDCSPNYCLMYKNFICSHRHVIITRVQWNVVMLCCLHTSESNGIEHRNCWTESSGW